MNLTEQQLRFFDTFGFLHFPGLFANDIDRITESFERVWENHGGGHQGRVHDHKRRSAMMPFIDQDEYLCGLLDDRRLDGIASAILGNDYNYTVSDGNFYVGDTQWHSDFSRSKPTIKAAFYLDKVTKESGCLRVIPGSHKIGDVFATSLKDMMSSQREQRITEVFGIHGSEVPGFALESMPGDLVCFDRRIKHASFGGGTRRRMFTIVLEPRYPDDELDILRTNIGNMSKFWVERAYGHTMINTAGPERMVHLEQRLANDDHLAELTRIAKRDMEEPARG